jgi:hypothetical protein
MIVGLIFSCQKEDWGSVLDPTPRVRQSGIDKENPFFRECLTPTGLVITVEPTNIDDTDNLLAAFEVAANTQERVKVVLTQGVFYLRPIVIENFNGKLEGAGKDLTTIHPVPGQDVGEISFFNKPTAEAPWPVLMTFSGGNISVSDMTFDIRILDPVHWTYGDWEGDVLYGVLMITGDHANTIVERVGFIGRPMEGGFLGYNVGNALVIQGTYSTPWTVSGVHRIYSCSFTNVAAGAVGGLLGDVHLTIGGSDSKGNTFEDVYFGVEVSDFSNSTIDISHNKINSADYEGMRAMQGYYHNAIGQYAPAASSVSFKHNTIKVGGEAWGVNLTDLCYRNGGPELLGVSFRNNTIHITGAQRGIHGIGLLEPVFHTNTVSGSAYFGAFFNYMDGGLIINNNFDNLLSGSQIDVLLHEATSYNKVVCGKFDTQVVDLGDHNEVICPVSFISDIKVKEQYDGLLKGRVEMDNPWMQ